MARAEGLVEQEGPGSQLQRHLCVGEALSGPHTFQPMEPQATCRAWAHRTHASPSQLALPTRDLQDPQIS